MSSSRRLVLAFASLASLAVHASIASLLVPRAVEPSEDAPPVAAPLTGDGVLVPELDELAESVAPSEDRLASEGAAASRAAPEDPGPEPPTVAPKLRARGAARPSRSGAEAAAPALYGAVGERAAVDLATAFTRGFPQAASADPAWASAPLGPAGLADLTLTLDPAGRITDAVVLGSPSTALRRGIERTVALLRGRSFTARAATTKLRVSGSVSPDRTHDGLHGDVFAIGGSYTSGSGSAFFALAIGRRIDVSVRGR